MHSFSPHYSPLQQNCCQASISLLAGTSYYTSSTCSSIFLNPSLNYRQSLHRWISESSNCVLAMAAPNPSSTLVCYHYPCPDGIFAALAAHLHFKGKGLPQPRWVPNRVYAPVKLTDLSLTVRLTRHSSICFLNQNHITSFTSSLWYA